MDPLIKSQLLYQLSYAPIPSGASYGEAKSVYQTHCPKSIAPGRAGRPRAAPGANMSVAGSKAARAGGSNGALESAAMTGQA